MKLSPESGHNVEVGVDYTFLKDFNFSLTGFHTELDNEIMYLYSANMNAPDHTSRDGFETSLTWSRERVGGAGVMYSFVNSRFTEGEYRGNYLPMVPRQQVRVFGEVFLVDWLSVNGGYRFVGRQRYDSDFGGKDGYLPDYGVFDVGLRIKPTWGWLDGFTLSFTVDNLFNRRYANYGVYNGEWATHSVYPADGRTFLLTLRYEW